MFGTGSESELAKVFGVWFCLSAERLLRCTFLFEVVNGWKWFQLFNWWHEKKYENFNQWLDLQVRVYEIPLCAYWRQKVMLLSVAVIGVLAFKTFILLYSSLSYYFPCYLPVLLILFLSHWVVDAVRKQAKVEHFSAKLVVVKTETFKIIIKLYK